MIPTFESATDFVPANLDASRWENLEPLYRSLIDRDLHCKNCLERLIVDRSELDAAASEAGSQVYIAMTCRTDDEAASKAYMDFVQQVRPKLKEVGFELDKKIATSPYVKELDQARYGVLLRDLKAAVELFRPENIPLETEEAEIEQEYTKVSGAMTVTWDGEEVTLQKMSKLQEETDRAVRERAWRLVAERRLADREAIERIYDRLLPLRQRIAKNAGFADYRGYIFKARRRFDYTWQDCESFAQGVEKHVVPALRRLNKARAAALGLARLRPWDLAVDPKGRPPLKPFKDGDDLFAKSQRVFDRMDQGLGAMFSSLRGGGCLDLESRKGKAPGGYQAMRDRMRMPFIFMNAVGVQRDVETMVHEAGHAFHSLLCRGDPILAYRSDVPLEFAEVASMSMELTSGPFLAEFYGSQADAQRAQRVHLEQLATMLPWIATIDQFQHWVYTHPGHTHGERAAAWNALMDRFGADADWTGLEDVRTSLWQRQLHLFGAPFYYIEYGIAQLGALQLYGNYTRDAGRAMADYKKALALGGSRPLRELFREAGLDFDFSPPKIERTWAQVERELERLPV